MKVVGVAALPLSYTLHLPLSSLTTTNPHYVIFPPGEGAILHVWADGENISNCPIPEAKAV